MPMHNLIEYCLNYSETTGGLWLYSNDETSDFNNNNFKSSRYKAKLLGNTVAEDAPNQANGILKSAAVAVSLKNLSNFWRSLDMPLVNLQRKIKT